MEVLKSSNSFPTGPFLPQISNKKKPTTVGGRIKGKVNNPSINPLDFPLKFDTKYDVMIPKKNVIIVATKDVFIEIHK